MITEKDINDRFGKGKGIQHHAKKLSLSVSIDRVEFKFYVFLEGYSIFLPKTKFKRIDYVPPMYYTDPYLPKKEIQVYENLSTGNIVTVESSTPYNFPNRPMTVKVSINYESTPITQDEYNDTIKDVIDTYRKKLEDIRKSDMSHFDKDEIKKLIVPVPFLSEVEVAIDHHTAVPAFFYMVVRALLCKKMAKKRIDYPPSFTGEKSRRGKWEYDSVDETFYIGKKSSSHILRNYFKTNIETGEKIFRMEIVLRQTFLAKNHIKSFELLKKVNFSEYWTNYYYFYDIENLITYISKKYPPLVNPIIWATGLDDNLIDVFKRLRKQKTINGKDFFSSLSHLFASNKYDIYKNKIRDALLQFSAKELGTAFELPKPKVHGKVSQTMDTIQQAVKKLKAEKAPVTCRRIASITGLSKDTVNRYIYHFKKKPSKLSKSIRASLDNQKHVIDGSPE